MKFLLLKHQIKNKFVIFFNKVYGSMKSCDFPSDITFHIKYYLNFKNQGCTFSENFPYLKAKTKKDKNFLH